MPWQAGTSYTIVVTLLNLDDSVLELYDTDRTTQLAQNDDFGDTLASALDWTCPVTGTYYIKVRGYDTSNRGTFSLAVQPTATNGGQPGGNDACVAPVQLSGAGEIDFTDSYQDNTVCQWTVTCPAGNEVALTIDSLDVEAGYDYLDITAGRAAAPVAHLTGSTLPNPATFTSAGQTTATISFTSDESVASRGFHLSYGCSVSSGQTAGGACTPVTVGARPDEGNIDTASGSITYCLTATGGTTYQISVDLETLSDSILTLFAPDGLTQLAQNDDYGSGLSSYLEWTAPADGVYRIQVSGYGTETGTFLMTVSTGGDNPCSAGGVTLSQDNGNIFFSNAYEAGVTCHWTVTCNDGSPTLEFQAFDTESDYDFVTLYDGPTARAPQLVHLSGTMQTLPQTSAAATGSSMYVEFTSDDSVGGQGFDASWECRRTGGGGTGTSVTTQTATPLSPGRPTPGTVSTPGAPVPYSLVAEGGVTYEVDVSLQTLSDSTMQILDRDGQTVLSENDDYGDGLSSHITWTAPLSGTYFVLVSGYGTETGSFTVIATANTGTSGGATGNPCSGGLVLSARSDVVSYRPRGQYEQNAMCSWEINCGTDQVTWTFTSFDTEGGFDYVTLFEGQCDECAQAAVIATLSGGMDDLEQLSFSSTGTSMTIQFTSDGSISNDGFEGSYACGTPPESPYARGRANTHTPPPPPPSTGSPGTVNHHDSSGASDCEDGASPISENAKLSDAQINALAGGGEKIFKLVSPGENLEPRATYYLRSQSAYTDTSPGMGLLPVQWSLDWQSGGWSAPNPQCASSPADCFDTFAQFGQQNGGNTCNRIFTDYSGEVGCFPLTGQRCFSDGFECGHQLISDFELRVQTSFCTGAGIVAMSPPGVGSFSTRCDSEGFAKVLQVHTTAYTPTAEAIAPSSITQCNSGSASRVGPLYCSSITPYTVQTGVHCDAYNAGCSNFGSTTGPGTGVGGGALQCVQAVGPSQRLWSDRQYAWTDGPTDILDGVWSYVMVPLEAGSGAPCPTEGGFRGAVAEEATIAVCCANHCAGNPVPTGANGWQEHPGQWSIDGHPGTPCTFFETRIPAGEYNICCESCWASGVFFAHPSDQHLSANGPGHQDTTADCTGIDTTAKLSDAQINSVAPGAPKIFKIVSPGEGSAPRAMYYMRSAHDYVDTRPGMGLLPVSWSDHDWRSGNWDNAASCSKQRVDSECLFGNTCNRIFTDYSSEIGCYPNTGQRCFNDGAPCGHQLIQDFELWIRAEALPGGASTSSCAEIGQAGVHTISPPGIDPFQARCDEDGFMKILQISDSAYTPSADAIAADKITQCNPGVGLRSGALYCASLTPDISASASVPCRAGQTCTARTPTRCIAAVLGSEALWSDRDYAWEEGPGDILDGAWTYVRVPLEVGHGAPCPHEGGFRGTVAETATVAICCANHCAAGLNVPVSSDGAVFSEHPGMFSITQHDGAPCTFYEARITPGDYQICCSTCWASGAFFANPSSTHLSADTTCSPITTDAKLSDAQINSVAPRRAKIFKLLSPGENDEPRGEYFMRSTRDYQDTMPGLGLLPVEWARDGWQSGDWNAAAGSDGTPGSCTAQRIDTECLYGNTCERIFTDYSSAVGCYPDQGQRCFNDGVSCGHQLIEDFEMWVRAEEPLGTGSSSCASIGQAGVFTITPMNVPPFRARCDGPHAVCYCCSVLLWLTATVFLAHHIACVRVLQAMDS